MLAVDRLVELGGIPADISPATRDKLDAVLPPTWSKSNPVDIVGDSDPARYAAALELLLADASNDAVLVMNVQTAIARADDIAAAVIGVVGKYRAEHRMSPKPVLAVWVGADQPISDLLSGAGIPNYQTGGDAVLGFMHLVRHREVVADLAQVPPAMPSEFAPDADAARQIVAAALADGRSWLDPIEVKRLFDAYDIAVVPTFAAADAEEAVAHANAIFAQGSTVVLKIMSRDIVHKSDVGGVVLNLTNADAVRKATAEILARARSLRPEARISGVMVQAMVVRAKARELILGLADDPTFGTVVVFGRGGTAVEIINDKALALPPLDLQLARGLIERTRVSRLLRAYRDVPAVKPDAVAMVLVKLAQMAADIPEIRGLDINPLLADEAGVLAVDARVVVGRVERKFRGSGPANFAVRPYPSQWQRHIEVKDGWRVYVRPIRPEDEPLIHEMLKHVTMQDLRLRFFAPMKQFSHEFVARLTQLDYARAMAFVAFDEATNELVGVVRIHSDFDLSERRICDPVAVGPQGQGPRLGADADDHRICEIGRVEGHLGRRSGRQHRDAGDVPQPWLRSEIGPGGARHLQRQADAVTIARAPAAAAQSRRGGGMLSMREQDRERRLRQQALGGAAEDELAPARVPIGTHHENVDLMRNGVGFEHLADPPAVGVDLVQHDVDAVAGQVLGQRFGGMVAVQLLFVGNGDDPDLPGLFEQRHGIGNRTGRGAAEIPGDGDGPQFERARPRTLGQDEDRPARSEYHGFCVPLVVAFRHRHDGEVAKPRVVYQQIRHGEGRAFFELGFVQDAGFLRRSVECGQHVPGALPALFSFARNDAGNVGRRARQEVPGHFDMDFAGHRRQVSAEGCSDRDCILGDRRRGGVGITRQCQQNVLERHRALLFPELI